MFIALSVGGTRIPNASVPPTIIVQKRKYLSHCALYNGIKSIKCVCSVIGPAVPGSHGFSSQQPGSSLDSSGSEGGMAVVNGSWKAMNLYVTKLRLLLGAGNFFASVCNDVPCAGGDVGSWSYPRSAAGDNAGS